jgi:hypothetical protein
VLDGLSSTARRENRILVQRVGGGDFWRVAFKNVCGVIGLVV